MRPCVTVCVCLCALVFVGLCLQDSLSNYSFIYYAEMDYPFELSSSGMQFLLVQRFVPHPLSLQSFPSWHFSCLLCMHHAPSLCSLFRCLLQQYLPPALRAPLVSSSSTSSASSGNLLATALKLVLTNRLCGSMCKCVCVVCVCL